MEAEEGCIIVADGDRLGKRCEVSEFVGAEPFTCPRRDFVESTRFLAVSRRYALEQPPFSVAAESRAAELAQALDGFVWLRPAGRDVAEADDLLDLLTYQVVEDRLERDAVSVDVADEDEAARIGLLGGCRSIPPGGAAAAATSSSSATRIRPPLRIGPPRRMSARRPPR